MSEHKHTLTCGHGLRVVPMSTEILTHLLQGHGAEAVPVNVPPDMQVVGSMTKADLLSTTGLPYPSGRVVLLCSSQEWERRDDIDHATNDLRIFEPMYRRSA